jgi:hypothetical protein
MSRRTSLATRKQRRNAEELRKNDQIDQLIDRLTKHALSEKPLMDESQVQSALTLLNKLLPDLSVTNPLVISNPLVGLSDSERTIRIDRELRLAG